MRQRPSRATGILIVAGVLVAAECWPRTWPQTALPRVPAFYQQLAADPDPGAVVDLPHGWNNRSDRASAYMYYQMVHGKPIAWSYLSRYYKQFPNAGVDGLWHQEAPAGPELRARLRALGFRYVVFHRYSGMFVGGRVSTGMLAQPAGRPTPPESQHLLRDAFGGEAPIYQDDLVIVWAVTPAVSAPAPATPRAVSPAAGS